MMFLSIAGRELRLAARHWRTYYSRLWAGGGAFAVALYFVWSIRQTMGGAMVGVIVLKLISTIAFFLAIFLGINRTADSLSSEKRGDTLGLLFLTHLKARDIVLGKLLSGVLHTVFLLASIIPILSVPVLLGGVTGAEIVRVPASLLNATLLALAVGILVSSLARHQRNALLIAGSLMIFLVLLLPALAELVRKEWGRADVALILSLPSPAYSHGMAFAGTIGLSQNFFWTAVAVQLGISGAAVGLACFVLPHSWQTRSTSSAGWRVRTRNWILGTGEERIRRRKCLLGLNPIFWLNVRERFGPVWAAAFAVGLLGLTVGLIARYEVPKEPAWVLIMSVLVVIDLSMRARVASIASAELALGRQSGALEMILSTPIRIDEIIKGQWMAVRHKLLWTYVPMLLLFVVAMATAIKMLGGDRQNLLIASLFCVISAGDFIAIGYVAMWQGIRVQNPAHAPGLAMVRVLLTPMIIWMAAIPVLTMNGTIARMARGLEPYGVLLLAFLVWFASSGLAFYQARRNLLLHFREAATDRYIFEKKIGLLPRLLPITGLPRLREGSLRESFRLWPRDRGRHSKA